VLRRVGQWGGVRLRVGQFLANLWHAIVTTRAGIAAVRQARRGWFVVRVVVECPGYAGAAGTRDSTRAC
jgi:hypothetical protein